MFDPAPDAIYRAYGGNWQESQDPQHLQMLLRDCESLIARPPLRVWISPQSGGSVSAAPKSGLGGRRPRSSEFGSHLRDFWTTGFQVARATTSTWSPATSSPRWSAR